MRGNKIREEKLTPKTLLAIAYRVKDVFKLSTVNSVALNSVATINSVAGFSAVQKATELTVGWNFKKSLEKIHFSFLFLLLSSQKFSIW